MADVTVWCFLIYLALCASIALCQLKVPPVEILPLIPKGFRVTIKDEGFKFFGWRGNINKEFEERDEGDIQKDLNVPMNGNFTFTDRTVRLNVGDRIYYWTFIIPRDSLGTMSDVQEFTVTEFFNMDGSPVATKNRLTTDSSPDDNSPAPESIPGNVDNRMQSIYPDQSASSTMQSCIPSITILRNGAIACEGSVIFSEEFNESSLSNKWDAEVKFPLEPDFPYNLYSPDNGTLSIVDGNLVITPKLTDRIYTEQFLQTGTLDLGARCMPEKSDQTDCIRTAFGALILPPVATAKVTTKKTLSFKFGKIEVRAKMPSGDWLLPEINLEPSNPITYGSKNYLAGLMRIAFVKGNDLFAKKLYGGPLLSDKEPFRSLLLQQKIGRENWNKDFHVYTMIWKPDGIELFVDGENYGSVDPGEGFYSTAMKYNVERAGSWLKGTIMAPLDEMFHLSLGLRVGGINDFEDATYKPWHNSNFKALLLFYRNRPTWTRTWELDPNLKVDYVRVYAL